MKLAIKKITIVVGFITLPFFLYHSGNSFFRHVLCDETYNQNVAYPCPSNKGIRVDVNISIDGDNATFSQYIRNHKYLEFSALAFIYSTYSTSMVNHTFNSGNKVFIDLRTMTICYYDISKGIFKLFFSRQRWDECCVEPDVFDVKITDVVGDHDYISSSSNLYDFDNFMMTHFKPENVYSASLHYGKNIKFCDMYLEVAAVVVPQNLLNNVSIVHDYLGDEEKTILIRDVKFNDAVEEIVRSQYIEHGYLCCSSLEHPFRRSFLMQNNNIWTIDKSNMYVQTSYIVGETKYCDYLDKEFSNSIELLINNISFNVSLDDRFSVFDPVGRVILFYCKDYSKYIIPDYVKE